MLAFGSLKSSPAAALVVCMVFPVIQGFFYVHGQRLQLRWAREGSRQSVVVADSLMPTSVYTDIQIGNLLQCVAIFAGQIMLYCLVLQGVWEREHYAERVIPTRATSFFLAGTVVAFMQEIVFIIEDSWRREWASFWSVYIGKPGVRARRWAWSRVGMSFVVNYYFQKTMVLVLPLFLMESRDCSEFVKDATSVLFIAKIDDIIFAESHRVPLKSRDETEEPDLSTVADAEVEA
ncbi:ext1c [Symbiodinium sp. CCMP2592]|nr:ext1c [Symbiodinium sp. CCMP2592]